MDPNYINLMEKTFQDGIEDERFNSRAVFEYKTSFIPRRCYNSGRWIWGVSMRGRMMITGPGDPLIIDRWYHRHEAVIMMLKGLARER